MITLSQMFAKPEFWLPLGIPFLFGIISVIFETLPLRRKSQREAAIYILRLSISICFSCLAIDLWALTTSISTLPLTGIYSRFSLIALTILFLLIHMAIYALCLLAIDEYRSTNPKGRFMGLTSVVWVVILTIISISLILFERIRVYELFYI